MEIAIASPSFRACFHVSWDECMAVLRAVLGPLVIDSIMGALFMRSVLLSDSASAVGGGEGGSSFL